MADPFTLLAVVGGGSKVLGSIMQTNSEVGQYKTQSAIEAENAKRLGYQSQQAMSLATRNEEQQRREYRDFAGSQLAAIGEGGLASGGSILDVVRDSEARANLDALKVRYEGTTRGQALADEGRQAKMRSSLARQMASRARIAGTLGTIGEIASAGASINSAMKGGK